MNTGSLEALGSFLSMVLDIISEVLRSVTVAAAVLFIKDKASARKKTKKSS